MITILKLVESSGNKAYIEMQGPAADKPATTVSGFTIKSGSTYWEINGRKGWMFDENNINPATTNHWWEV